VSFVEEDEMDGACSTNGEKRKLCRLLVGKPEGKRPLGRPGQWLDNIEMDFVELGCVCMNWIGLVQNRDNWRALVNLVMNL
jgi:hypothetical protein